MKIYFLRHEKRPNEQYFDVSLTEEGVKDSYKLKDTLKELRIHEIYSSPFIRVLETVQPFIIENNLQINIEYSLYEFVTHNWFNENNYNKIFHKIYLIWMCLISTFVSATSVHGAHFFHFFLDSLIVLFS